MAGSIALSAGDGWHQGALLLVALVLSSFIGVERELRQKSAGLRTHALVGVGAALFMLVSKFGFSDVLGPHVQLDPSRVAAQIVTGIGFIGGGLIFVRRDMVRGLTTAAAVWLTAAVGAAAGAGLVWLALGGAVAHFLVVYGYTPIVRRLPGAGGGGHRLTLRYRNGAGALRAALEACSEAGFTVTDVSVEHDDERGAHVTVSMTVSGKGKVPELVGRLGDLPGVLSATAGEESPVGDIP